MITRADFDRIRALLGATAEDDIAWAERVKPPESAEDFASEAIYVICNSGMHNKVARKIFDRVMAAIGAGQSAHSVFKHKGKATAIDTIWAGRADLLAEYMAAPDKVEYCALLPWIGGITKYHLAKNFGADVAKPDVHLQRLADREGVTPQHLCERLAKETGLRVHTVDLVLWRACAEGVLDSRSGVMEMALFAKVLGAAHCPSCGNGAKGHFTANKEEARAWAVRNGVDVALVLGSEAA